MNSSLEQFRRSVEERHKLVRSLSKALVELAPELTTPQLAEKARDFFRACEDLKAMLAGADIPSWLQEAIDQVALFIRSPQDAGTSRKFYVWFVARYLSMQEPILLDQPETIDFDEVYRNACDEMDVHATFDRLIEIVGDIIALDVIDSSTVSEALAKLKALLVTNKKASQAAIFATIEYGEFVRLILKGYVKTLAGVALGPALEAFDKVHNDARKRVEEAGKKARLDSLKKLAGTKGMHRLIDNGVITPEDLADTMPAGFLEQKPSGNESTEN